MDTSGSHTPNHGLPRVELPKTLITESGPSGQDKYELLTVGQVVSERYKILSVLGHGGMGAVYKVEQIFLRQMFALKTLHGQAFTEVAIRRFHKEAQAAGKLSHPNLVRAHDFGVLDNHHPFFVMDLVEGPNLSQYSRKMGTLSVEEVLDIFIPVCFGLGYAHEQGVIHRDIKPGNIMLANSSGDKHGYIPKVVDFGIAKFAENEEGHSLTLTRTGEVFGTPLYMSPEQCMGVKVDHRCDIYSLGCVIYESLTGAPPFHGDTALNLMMKHQTTVPSSLKEASMGREFPAQLEVIVAKTLIKDPNARYQNVFDLARDLASLKQELTQVNASKTITRANSQTVKDIPSLLSPVQPSKNNKPTWFVVSLCLASLLGGLALGAVLAPRPKTADKSVQPAQSQINDATKRKYEEALNVGNERYVTWDGGSAQPVQAYKFPTSFDIGLFKYTHPTIKGERSAAAQGTINVPLQSETFLRVPASRLYSYPHLLRGFQAGDLHHLQFVNDVDRTYEDMSFVYDTSLAYCASIRGLKEIFLFGTSVTDKGLAFIKDLPNLDSIDVSNTEVTAGAIRSLKKFPNLHYLGLKDMPGAKSLIGQLASSKTLQVLNLAGTDLDDKDMKQLSKISTLLILTVDSNPRITNEGLKEFKNLIALNMASTGVTPASMETLKKMPGLKILTISKEKWSARDVQKLIAGFPDLTVETKKLDSNNHLTNWNWREDL